MCVCSSCVLVTLSIIDLQPIDSVTDYQPGTKQQPVDAPLMTLINNNFAGASVFTSIMCERSRMRNSSGDCPPLLRGPGCRDGEHELRSLSRIWFYAGLRCARTDGVAYLRRGRWCDGWRVNFYPPPPPVSPSRGSPPTRRRACSLSRAHPGGPAAHSSIRFTLSSPPACISLLSLYP